MIGKLFARLSGEEQQPDKQKENLKNFDILKYDGIKALNIRQTDYVM
ncbi:hypothetical protein FACS1894123_01120 [Bacteroidia bacterium]|nr:hypothetical protein FACS1894123_01120 [Bacteroidia bacterium]